MAIAPIASAQTLHSLYFLEGNNQRNTLNPAFTSERGFVTFPALGNLSISANSNIGLGTFMTPRGNEMVTFMHESISNEDALSKFKKNNITLSSKFYAFGAIMSSGTTHLSNSSAVKKPDFIASSRKVVPLWCAVLAICAAFA